MNDQEILDQRLQKIKNLYLKADAMIDSIPDALPLDAKTRLKNAIFNDRELKELIEGIDSHRPPRLFLAGRTGIGKSSLINAICDAYVAQVSDTESCTMHTVTHMVKHGNRALLELCDTRGTKESIMSDNGTSADDALLDDVCRFCPDAAIYVLDCSRRDDVQTDVTSMRKLCDAYFKRNQISLPLVVVLNKCDDCQPSREKDPQKYPLSKKESIDKMFQFYSDVLNSNGLHYMKIFTVSSYIEWQTQDGTLVSPEDIKNLPLEEVSKLQIYYDGRYKIDELYDFLSTKAIQDHDAQMGMMMAARLNVVAIRIAKRLVHVFSAVSGIVGASPFIVHDIISLLILQSVMVCFIAALGGRDLTLEDAKEFVVGLLGIGGAGLTFRLIAQQVVKLANLWVKGAGSVASGGIAAAGTNSIGTIAIDYYINGKDIGHFKTLFIDKVKALVNRKNRNE